MSIAQVLIKIAIVFVLAYAVPVSSGSSLYAGISVLGVLVLLSMVMAKALSRRDALNEWMGLELNKVRRMYHLSKNLGQSDHLRAWFTDLHGFAYGYLMAFDKKKFSQYEETNADFRKLSYHVYQIPALQTDKERALYAELLDAAGTVAGARQRIKQIWEGSLPGSVWNTLVVMAALAGASVLLAVGSVDRLVAGLLLSVLVLGVSLVRNVDKMKLVPEEVLAKKYVENIARLELSREREEVRKEEEADRAAEEKEEKKEDKKE